MELEQQEPEPLVVTVWSWGPSGVACRACYVDQVDALRAGLREAGYDSWTTDLVQTTAYG